MYYQPRENKNISICGAIDMKCMKRVDSEIQIQHNSSFKCDHCLSGCFAITYDSTFSTAKIFDEVTFLRQHNLDTKNIAIVHIYYSRSSFRSQRKEELVSFTDFLCRILHIFFVKNGLMQIHLIFYQTAGVGGLLGLFMGFSVISLIELFYFISIRPYCNYLRFSNRRRELIAKVLGRIESLRRRKHSPITVMTVATNPDFVEKYHNSYLD